MACAVVPPGPPSNVFGNRGTPPVPPAGAAPPAPCLGVGVLFWPAPSFSGGFGLACAVVPPAHPPTSLETGGLPLYPRRGGAAPCTRLGSGGFVVACALFQGRVWLGGRRCPTWPTLQRYWKQGDSPCTPGRETRVPCTLLGGNEGSVAFLPGRFRTLPNLPPSTRAGTEPTPGGSCATAPRLGDAGFRAGF